MNNKNPGQPSERLSRRAFFPRAMAIVIGAIAGLVPTLAGLLVFLDPLRRKEKTRGDAIRVTSLSALPNDGLPRKFSVIASRTDAWNKFPAVPIGAVYLRRTGEKTVEALNVVCPHAGCFVDFIPSETCFLCPCHNSRFTLDGKIKERKSPSPRALDALAVEIRGGEIFVYFQNFRSGIAEKLPT